MPTDIRLNDQSVVVDGRLGIGIEQPDATVQASGTVHSSGQAGGFQFDSRNASAPAGKSWTLYADGGTARLWSGGDWATLFPNGTFSSWRYVIGSQQPARAVDIDGGIHVRGGDAGLSFADRKKFDYAGQPAKGERWEWYSTDGKAKLWSGSDKLTVGADGAVEIGTGKTGSLTIGQTTIGDGKITVATGVLIPTGANKKSPIPIANFIMERLDLIELVVQLRKRVQDLEAKVGITPA